jgi:hypothetical protein
VNGVVFVYSEHLRNPLNGNGYAGSRFGQAKKNREQRRRAQLHTLGALGKARVDRRELIPAIVTISRLSAGQLDDDNLAASIKHVRDGIADALGIDDGGPFVQWRYAQIKVAPKVYAVRVQIEKIATDLG